MLPKQGDSIAEKIGLERNSIWERAPTGRWKELCKLPEMAHFYTVQPIWYIMCHGVRHPIPLPVSRTIESDFVRKKTSVDIPASPALRFGRCAIDFTTGQYGQITLQHDPIRDNKYGYVPVPSSGTFLLDRSQRDESGKFFQAAVTYFTSLFKYILHRNNPETDAPLVDLRVDCQNTFKAFHCQYTRILLAYKFNSTAHERGFYEFLYLSTIKILRRFFRYYKLHGVIEEVVNKLFRSDSFTFGFRKQQVEWDNLVDFLHPQTEWNTEESELGGSATPALSTRTTSSSRSFAMERKFTHLVDPRKISLSRAMQSRSLLMTYRYPDTKMSVDLLSEKSYKPRKAPPSAPFSPNSTFTAPKIGASHTISSQDYQRLVEERLMPHDRLDDISIPYDALSEFFADPR